MTPMYPAIEAKFQLNMTIDKAYPKIYKALSELGLNDLRVIKEVHFPIGDKFLGKTRKPSFVVFNYIMPIRFKGWLISGHNIEIQLSFREVEGNTIVSLKWFYPTYEVQRNSSSNLFVDTVSLVEEFKSRVGATEITAESVKEIIKEKTVIVKVRCPYCSNLYDEALDKCPHCGGRR